MRFGCVASRPERIGAPPSSGLNSSHPCHFPSCIGAPQACARYLTPLLSSRMLVNCDKTSAMMRIRACKTIASESNLLRSIALRNFSVARRCRAGVVCNQEVAHDCSSDDGSDREESAFAGASSPRVAGAHGCRAVRTLVWHEVRRPVRGGSPHARSHLADEG